MTKYTEYLLDICFIPCPQNFRALAGQEVNIGQALSQHGPDMVLKSRHFIEMLLRPYLPGLENFRALASLKGKLGQTWSKIVQNCPNIARHGPNMAKVL